MAVSRISSWFKNIWNGFRTLLRYLAPLATLASLYIAYNSFKFAKKAKDEGAETTRRTVAMIDTMKIATTEILSNLKSIPGASESFKKGLDKMTGSIASLKTNLNAFSSSLQNYDKVLKTVADVTQKNVEIIREQQLIWRQELNKTPKLELALFRAVADTLGKIHIRPQVANLGNAAVQNFYIIISCPKEYKLQSSQMLCWDTSATIQSFSHTFSEFIGPARSKEDYDVFTSNALDFTIERLKQPNQEYTFHYAITHEKGTDEGFLTVRKQDIVTPKN